MAGSANQNVSKEHVNIHCILTTFNLMLTLGHITNLEKVRAISLLYRGRLILSALLFVFGLLVPPFKPILCISSICLHI